MIQITEIHSDLFYTGIIKFKKRGHRMNIIYYSETGNTKAMAEYVGEGIQATGKEVKLISAEDASKEDIIQEEIVIIGCPALGSEQYDDQYIEPLIEQVGDGFKGKKVALFGSYGWGNGEWLEQLENKIKSYEGIISIESLMVNELPEGEDAYKCKQFGEQIANL